MLKIELTDREAETWRILKESGVFDLANGSAELHFNNEGQLAKIDTHLMTFRRVKVNIPVQLSTTQLDANVNKHIL